ncbi:DUF5958 family protein [Sorangium sp. So ce1078]|uniref:DUF5958 family protein n=1 Tax=Sorangium sp. So ce1078 TaxID=3133329 RepID=UPI003F60D147
MNNHEDLLNELAQGFVTNEEGRHWFSQLAEGEQRDVLGKLWFFAAQAGARESDVDVAIARAQLKPSFTPCVLLRNGPLKVQAAKVLGLPSAENEKSFRLLSAMFQVADERRRKEECKDGCSHWWHTRDR